VLIGTLSDVTDEKLRQQEVKDTIAFLKVKN
jgi:hypothetical protein